MRSICNCLCNWYYDSKSYYLFTLKLYDVLHWISYLVIVEIDWESMFVIMRMIISVVHECIVGLILCSTVVLFYASSIHHAICYVELITVDVEIREEKIISICYDAIQKWWKNFFFWSVSLIESYNFWSIKKSFL